MKAKDILIVSIILNVVLGLLYAQKLSSVNSKDSGNEIVISEGPKDNNQSLPQGDDLEPVDNNSDLENSDPENVEETEQLFDWQLVESEDYLTYVANLRKIGCPEETITDIITADVEKLFKQRHKDFQKSLPPAEYWKANVMGGMGFSKEEMEFVKEMNKEKQEALKALLGSNYKAKPSNLMTTMMSDPSTMISRSVSFLPADKQSAVVDSYLAMQNEMIERSAESNGRVDQGTWYAEIMKKQDELLSASLSPDEKFEVDLRLSNLAQSMKFELSEFGVSEQEFRDMFALRQNLEKEAGVSQFDLMGNNNRETQQKYQEVQQQYKEELKNVLGDDRFSDYERSQDWSYRELNNIARQNEIGNDQVIEAYEIQKAAREATQSLNPTNMEASDLQQARRDIYNETAAALTEALGEKGFESFNDSSSSYWLRNLQGDQSGAVEIHSTTELVPVDVPVQSTYGGN